MSNLQLFDDLLLEIEKLVNSCNSLDTSDIKFYSATDPSFGALIKKNSNDLLFICNNLAEFTEFTKKQFEKLENVIDDYSSVVEVTDGLLEIAVFKITKGFFNG